MNRNTRIENLRAKLARKEACVGGWIQIPHPSIAEIFAASGFDWVAIDMEHGSISVSQLPDLFRAIELGHKPSLVRLTGPFKSLATRVMEAGADGVIIPNVNTVQQLIEVSDAISLSPQSSRGVGYCRANLFGKNFSSYIDDMQRPVIVAMIETKEAISNLSDILDTGLIDAIFVGPYDLSKSLGIVGDFENQKFKDAIDGIKNTCVDKGVPSGIHIITPSFEELAQRKKQGYQFIAYSLDCVMLTQASDFEKP